MKHLAIALLVLGCGGSDESPGVIAREDAIATDTSTSEDTGTAKADTSEPADTGTDVVAMMDTPADTAIVFGPYPAGPYGNKVGDVVANLAWEGYVNPTAVDLASTKPYVTTDLDKLRRDAKKGYALVHVSEFF